MPLNRLRIFPSLMLVALAALPASGYTYCDSISTNKTETVFPEDKQRHELIDNVRILFTGEKETDNPSKDSINTLISRFYVDQFRHLQDPRVPYFMLMSKDADLAMGIGGQVRMRGWFDWNGSIPANGFSPALIPIPKNPAQEKKLAATPAGTGLYFTIIGRNKLVKDFMAYIQGDFNGYQHIGFRLKKAYVIINDWTVGYAMSTFSDPAAEPSTIDGAGPNGKISKTNVLVRWLHTFKNRWSIGASFEFPDSHPDIDNIHTAECTDYLPDISALAQYQWDGGHSHVRLSGLMRFIPYRDLTTQNNHTVFGWGIQLSSTFKIIPDLSIYALGNIGCGHASYTGDLSVSNYDLVAKSGAPGELYAPTSFSLTFGAKYNFRPNIYACLTLAEQRYMPKGNPGDATYKYGLYGAVNIFWELTPRIQIGAEYLAGRKMNFDGSHGNANRTNALFQFAF